MHIPGITGLKRLPTRLTSPERALRNLTKHLRTLSGKLRISNRELAELRKLVETLPVGLHSLNRLGIITTVNSTEAKMLGYTKAEMIGKCFTEFIPEEQRAEAWDRYQRKMNGESVEKIVHRTYLHKNGTRIFVTSEDKFITNKQGQTSGVITVLHDITEINTIQEQVARLKVLEALAEMTSGVAHQINNIFGALTMGAEMISKRLPGDETANVMIDSCRKGARMAEALLHATQQAHFPRISVLANETIRSTIDQIIETTRKKMMGQQIFIATNYLPAPNIKADPKQIYQVILNLCQNSAESIAAASPEGGMITIKLEEKIFQIRQPTVNNRHLEPGKKYLVITVEDTGPGIPDAIRDKIFNPFFTTNDSKHHGLGLAEALGIIESLNGGIKLGKGYGTKVSVFIPAVS